MIIEYYISPYKKNYKITLANSNKPIHIGNKKNMIQKCNQLNIELINDIEWYWKCGILPTTII